MPFDPVSFEDYSADMMELSETAKQIIRRLRRERDDLEKMVYLILKETGPIEIDQPREPPSGCINKAQNLDTDRLRLWCSDAL